MIDDTVDSRTLSMTIFLRLDESWVKIILTRATQTLRPVNETDNSAVDNQCHFLSRSVLADVQIVSSVSRGC